MLNQWHHNLLLDEGVLLEVFPQAQDVIDHVEDVVVIDLRGQVLEDDVEQVIEFALDVAVGVDKLADAIGDVTLSGHEGADVREHVVLLVLEVGLDLMLILLEEADEHLSDAPAQVLRDSVEMGLDVRQAFIDIITVRLLQVRHQSRHVGAEDGGRRRHIVVERIDVANQQEEVGIYPTCLTDVG